MRIVVPAIGSRGDVQPYLNLCHALSAAGHEAIVAANPVHQQLAGGHGVRFVPVGEPIDLGRESALIMARSGRNWMRGLFRILKLGMKMVQQASAAVLELAKGADLLIVTDCGAGMAEAEAAGRPFVTVTLQPRRIPIADPHPSFGKVLQGVCWGILNPLIMAPMNRYRRTLGCPPMRDMSAMLSRELTLLPVSPSVAPPQRYWPVSVTQTGYWRNPLPPAWVPDPRLTEFLAAGEPPVAVSLGIMSQSADEGARKTARLILGAILERGTRVVIQGWDELIDDADLPRTAFKCGPLPHAWLFDRSRAVIHHGGFGTTASALCAGKPALVIPHLIDQFEWGGRVQTLGAGPAFLPRWKLDADGFRRSLDALLDTPEYAERAKEIGARIRSEPDGLEAGVRVIQERFNSIR